MGCTAPTKTHSWSMLHWLFLLVMALAQTGACTVRGQVLLVLVVQLCTGQWFGPSVGFAWQGKHSDNHCKVREGNHSSADRRSVDARNAKAPRAPHRCSVRAVSTLHCRINGPEFKEPIWTKYSKVFPRTVLFLNV